MYSIVGKESRIDPANLFKEGEDQLADITDDEIVSKLKLGYCILLGVGTKCEHDCRECGIATAFIVSNPSIWKNAVGL